MEVPLWLVLSGSSRTCCCAMAGEPDTESSSKAGRRTWAWCSSQGKQRHPPDASTSSCSRSSALRDLMQGSTSVPCQSWHERRQANLEERWMGEKKLVHWRPWLIWLRNNSWVFVQIFFTLNSTKCASLPPVISLDSLDTITCFSSFVSHHCIDGNDKQLGGQNLLTVSLSMSCYFTSNCKLLAILMEP